MPKIPGLAFISTLVAMFLVPALWAAPSEWTDFEGKRIVLLQELVPLVEICVGKEDTRHAVFHGCVDWHSAVHGHWALLRVSRVTGDERLLNIVRSSMQPAAMRHESEFLTANPRFEMPYGRAWFLKLIKEYEVATSDLQFRFAADANAATLSEYLLRRECDLERATYLNQSWAYRHLLEYYEHIQRADLAQSVRATISGCANPDVTLRRDHEKAEFFSVYGNLAHVYALALNDEDFDRWFAKSRPEQESLAPVTELQTPAHHLGVNLSRAWGMWSLYLRTGDLAYREAYVDHINESLRRHEKYVGAYYDYARWVPQFAIYAISSSMYID